MEQNFNGMPQQGIQPNGMPNPNMQPNGMPMYNGQMNNQMPGNMNAMPGYIPAYQQQAPMWMPKEDSARLTEMIADFRFFGVGSLIYGLLFASCLYRGAYGIGTSLITCISILYMMLVFKKWQIAFRKRDCFYIVSMMALSVSTCLTGDETIQFFNLCGVFLLAVAYLINHFVNTSKWGFVKYMTELIRCIFTPLSYLAYPLKSLKQAFQNKSDGKDGKAKYIWMGVLISVPLLFVIIALMVSADAVFSSMVENMFRDFTLPQYPILWILLFVLGSIGSFCLFAFLADDKLEEDCDPAKDYEPLIAITFLSLITVVYLVFSVIQILFLFIGNFELPAGYTYAEYAREGFFQLLVLCMLNLGIILICMAIFKKHTVLQVIMTVLSLCTYIMIASSAMRMTLYVWAYDLSYLRIMVYWGLVVIGLLLAGALVQIYKEQFPLFHYSMVIVTVCYICLAYARPSYLVAEYNITKNNVDYGYLVDLGTDAVPALVKSGFYKDEFQEITDFEIHKEESQSFTRSHGVRVASTIIRDYHRMGMMDFNVSKYKAGRLLIKQAEACGVEEDWFG